MPIYNVYVYREMQVEFWGIEAATPEAAAALAAEKPSGDATAITGCDGENFAALVNPADGREFGQSVTIDFEARRQREAAWETREALKFALEFLEANDNGEDDVAFRIAAARKALAAGGEAMPHRTTDAAIPSPAADVQPGYGRRGDPVGGRPAPGLPGVMTEAIMPVYDDYEIHGCMVCNDERGWETIAERCPDGDADFWRLYGHIGGQGVQAIADFETREAAEEVYSRIKGQPLIKTSKAEQRMADRIAADRVQPDFRADVAGLMPRLEAFADEFARLATTHEQQALAASFGELAGDVHKSMAYIAEASRLHGPAADRIVSPADLMDGNGEAARQTQSRGIGL